MDKSIERYKARRDERLRKRMDDDWITIKGTHVMVDDDGQVSKGPAALKNEVKKGGGYKPGTKKPRRTESGEKGGWKGQLKEYAQRGVMPRYISGPKEQQAEVMKEINKLYKKPDIPHTFFDQGDAAYVMWEDGSGKTSRAFYPSGKEATQEEKDGVLKHLMISHQQEEANSKKPETAGETKKNGGEKFSVPSGLKEADVKGMKRKDLENLATSIYANKAMEQGLSKEEGVHRAKSLMSGNTDAQLRKYIVKNSPRDIKGKK